MASQLLTAPWSKLINGPTQRQEGPEVPPACVPEEKELEKGVLEGSSQLLLMMLLALSLASSTVVSGRLTFFICKGMRYS